MLSIKYLKVALGCALYTVCVIASASQPEAEKSVSDVNVSAVCSVPGLEKLHTKFQKIAAKRSPEQGWDLIKAMICLNGPAADKIIHKYLPGDLMMRVGGTGGGQDYAVANDSGEVKAGYGRGDAWGGTVEQQDNDIWVNFMTDEICWKGFTIRFDHKIWKIFELNSGCD